MTCRLRFNLRVDRRGDIAEREVVSYLFQEPPCMRRRLRQNQSIEPVNALELQVRTGDLSPFGQFSSVDHPFMAARVDVNNMIVAGSKRSDLIRSEQGTRGNVETVSRDQGQCVEDCENAFRDQPAAIVETCSDVVRDGSGCKTGDSKEHDRYSHWYHEQVRDYRNQR